MTPFSRFLALCLTLPVLSRMVGAGCGFQPPSSWSAMLHTRMSMISDPRAPVVSSSEKIATVRRCRVSCLIATALCDGILVR